MLNREVAPSQARPRERGPQARARRGRRGGGERKNSSAAAAASAIREFYEYHRLDGRGPTDLRLSKTAAYSSRTRYHFMAHVEQRRSVEVNRLAIGLRRTQPPVQLIAFENDFRPLLNAASTERDHLPLSACYDLGLRIGQALGLRHSDLDPMRLLVTVERREANLNGALSKQRKRFVVKAPPRFFRLYKAYLLDELLPAAIDSDYLFVNLSRQPVGRPVSYNNACQVIAGIAARAGLTTLHPHMLRHTHATALEMSGVAPAASFGSSRERPLPALQRAGPQRREGQAWPLQPDDLRCHHPGSSDVTMMHPVRLHRMMP